MESYRSYRVYWLKEDIRRAYADLHPNNQKLSVPDYISANKFQKAYLAISDKINTLVDMGELDFPEKTPLEEIVKKFMK